MEEDELEDIFDGAPLSYIPRESCQAFAKAAKAKEDIETDIYLNHTHERLKHQENRYLSTRAKSFELLRNQEESLRYHAILCAKEKSEGILYEGKLLDEILTEKAAGDNIFEQGLKQRLALQLFKHFNPDDTSQSQNATRSLIENYLGEFTESRDSTHTISFPWPRFDSDVEVSCLTLLRSNQIDQCRSYLIGYFECIGRLEINLQTEQGRIFTAKVGWALGRHPFGSVVTVIVVAMKLLLNKVQAERLTCNALATKIKCVFEFAAQAWLLRYNMNYDHDNGTPS